MLSRLDFINYIEKWKTFDAAFNRIESALCGDERIVRWSNLYEADWVESVGEMLDIFLTSHFTNEGCDLINGWLFEGCREIFRKIDNPLFNDVDKVSYTFETPGELYDYMLKFKEEYFLE